jgi:hypothetical protein
VPVVLFHCPIYGQTAKNVRPLTAKPGEHWVIRWNRSDDFSGSAVNWRMWQKTPANFSAWKWDNENNVSVANGLLTITLRKHGDGRAKSAAYTSGMLKSYATGRYGYFEARIKAAPLFPGVSPAFWLYSRIDDSQTQPGAVRYCEVDIVELTQRNSHATGMFNSAITICMRFFQTVRMVSPAANGAGRTTPAIVKPRLWIIVRRSIPGKISTPTAAGSTRIGSSGSSMGSKSAASVTNFGTNQ